MRDRPNPIPATLCALGLLFAEAPEAFGRNVLLVIMDDVGVRQVGTYGESPTAIDTPTLDALAARGVLFRNAWSHPVCSPTRAAILTGLHAFRTGIGTSVEWAFGIELESSQTIVPEVFGGTSAVIGKWHLTNSVSLGSAYKKPVTWGFELHAGAIENIGVDRSFYDWERNVALPGSTVQGTSTVYATTQNVDDALTFLAGVQGPWFLVLAFSAAHKPWEDPPPGLHAVSPLDSDRQRYRAMIQALDTELGRLMQVVHLDETAVIVVGDNGTPQQVGGGEVPPGHGKSTVYEDGVNVPLIVAGALVDRPGRRSPHLAADVDLFATVLDLMGAEPPPSDAVSLVPYLVDASQTALRSTVYTEIFEPNGGGPYTRYDFAIRDGRHKLVSRDGVHELYELGQDPTEIEDLLAGQPTAGQQAAYAGLLAAAQELQGSPRPGRPGR